MSIKQYSLSDTWKEWKVVVEVDHAILTTEKAAMINEFWTNDKDRLRDAGGDVVRAVVKKAAETLVFLILEKGGGLISGNWSTDAYSRDLHNEEGWGGPKEGSRFGWCGIRLVRADVDTSFDLEFEGCDQ